MDEKKSHPAFHAGNVKTQLPGIKFFKLFSSGNPTKLPIQTIAPPMVGTDDRAAFTFTVDQSSAPVATGVMKCIQVALSISDNHQFIESDTHCLVTTRFREFRFEAGKQPAAAEDIVFFIIKPGLIEIGFSRKLVGCFSLVAHFSFSLVPIRYRSNHHNAGNRSKLYDFR